MEAPEEIGPQGANQAAETGTESGTMSKPEKKQATGGGPGNIRWEVVAILREDYGIEGQLIPEGQIRAGNITPETGPLAEEILAKLKARGRTETEIREAESFLSRMETIPTDTPGPGIETFGQVLNQEIREALKMVIYGTSRRPPEGDITPEVELKIAEILLKMGKFSTLQEAAGWIDGLRAIAKEKEPEGKKEVEKAILRAWKAMVPPGSMEEGKINLQLREIWERPEEIKRLQEKLRRREAEIRRLKKEKAAEEEDRLGAEPADFELLRRTPFTRVDPKGFEQALQVIPPELSKKDLVFDKTQPDGSRVIKYQRQTENSRITSIYTIPEGVKGEIPVAGSFAQDVAIQAFKFAYQQRTLSPDIGPAEMLRMIGYADEEVQAGGKKYERLINAFQTLAYGTYTLEKKRRGKWSPIEIGHFYSNLKLLGGEKITVIKPTFARDAIALLAKWLSEEEGGRYLSIPQNLIEDRHLSRDQKKFCYWLAKFGGFDKPPGGKSGIAIKKILSDPEILAYSKDRLRQLRPGEIIEILAKITAAALEKKLVTRWEYIYGKDRNIKSKAVLLSLRIKLYPPPVEKKEQWEEAGPSLPWEVDPLPHNLSAVELAKTITAWAKRPQFRVSKSREDYEAQILAKIKRHGEETIERLFREEGNALKPNPFKFWERIKTLEGNKRSGRRPTAKDHRAGFFSEDRKLEEDHRGSF